MNLIPGFKAISPLAKTQTAKTGPTLAGCSLAAQPRLAQEMGRASKHELHMHFNASLLRDESLLLRPWDADMRHWASKTTAGKTVNKDDSAGLMVCTVPEPDPEDPSAPRGNASTCACSQWAVLTVYKGGTALTINYCAVGPGWKPSAETNPLIYKYNYINYIYSWRFQISNLQFRNSLLGTLLVV